MTANYEVATIGHVLMDIRVLVDRLPRADEEAEIHTLSYGAGGSAANTANAIIRLGHTAAVIAKIGMDNMGKLLHEELSLKRIGLEGLRIDSESNTGFSLVIVDSTGNIMILGNKGAAEKLRPDELDKKLIASAKIIHIASLRLDTSLEAARTAKESQVLVTWDPGRRLARRGLNDSLIQELLKYVDYVLLNREEAYFMTGLRDVNAAAKKILEKSKANAVIVKLGAEGALLVTRNNKERHLPAYKVKPVDTTGAGDAFAAGFIVGLLEGKSLEEAAELGNATAAIKVTRLGAQSHPLREEVELLIKHYKYFTNIGLL
ncbi:MAG: carbohydrate kinase family protein [Pyrodictiaceae archaeon]